MILEEYLQETMYINNEITCAYVKIGRKASELMTKKDVKVYNFSKKIHYHRIIISINLNNFLVILQYVRVYLVIDVYVVTFNTQVQIPIRKSNKSTSGVATVSTVNSKEVDNNIKELHDRCYAELMTIIREIADTLDVSASSIMNMVAIRVMSQRLPENEEAMLQVPHVTKANFVKYGRALLNITQKYAAEKIGITSCV